MNENRKLADNVTKFLFEAAESYGRIKAEQFSQNMFCDLIESSIGSPIEDLFYLALHVQCAATFEEVNPEPIFNTQSGTWRIGHGVHVQSQAKIGKYRVDFLVSYTDGPQPNQVVVELDGHAFHDKDKSQRAYEKGRDRYLVSNGHRVLHYTGSEVVADPYKVAYEVLDILGANQCRPDYSASNPFGIDE